MIKQTTIKVCWNVSKNFMWTLLTLSNDAGRKQEYFIQWNAACKCI